MRHPAVRACLLVLAWLVLAACTRTPQVQFIAEGQPAELSDWGVLHVDGATLRLSPGVVPYDLNTPLFSDYAHKLRTVWMPAGAPARYQPERVFDLPVGTILSKTFYYPLPAGTPATENAVARTPPSASVLRDGTLDLRTVRLIETRLLVHRAEGWVALPYVWNREQTRATLKRTGELVELDLLATDGTREPVQYQVPDQNQCGGCHITDNKSRRLLPIGLKARHLNRDFDYAGGRENQLARLVRVGYLGGAPAFAHAPRSADAADANADLDARARAYLDVNCGHCHSATGPAITSGLWLEDGTRDRLKLGFCKQPIAAGKGTGDRRYDIVPGRADASIFDFRMDSTDPSVMMPELGRSVVHREGVELIRAWINRQPGSCDTAAGAGQDPPPAG